MIDLANFLLARIAEDKAEAQRGVDDAKDFPDGLKVTVWDLDIGIRYKPLKVLADCQAKLWIVVLHTPARTARAVAEEKDYMSCPVCDPFPPADNPDPGPCETLRLLAAPYTDHPDHQGEWRLWNQQGEPTRHPGGATPV